RIRIADVNWLGDGTPAALADEGLPVFVRVRSTRAPRPATLYSSGSGFDVVLDDGEEGVAPGQACVIYDSDGSDARVLGGGVIKGTVRLDERPPANAGYAAAMRG